MVKGRTIKATHGSNKTPITLGAVEIPCYVLEDGTRVLSGRGIQKAIGSKATSGSWLKNLINRKEISVHFQTGILDKLNNPISFTRPDAGGSQSVTYGYEATLFIDIIEAIEDAYKTGYNIDENIIKSIDILSKALKRVSIIALVDEATGYQYEREKDALQVVLQAYINTELLKWQKNFPDSFYFEIFRLNNWDYTVTGINKRPGVIGTWTNELIYKQLPKGILDELKTKTPKSSAGNYTARFFQSLTPDIGHPALTAQIYKVIGLMEGSDNWNDFKTRFNKAINRSSGQIELNFDAIEEKIEEEIKPNRKTKQLSVFNTNLKKGLEFNPKEDRKKKE